MLAFYKVYIGGEPGLWPWALRNSKALSNSRPLTGKLSSVAIISFCTMEPTKVEASLRAENREVLCKAL